MATVERGIPLVQLVISRLDERLKRLKKAPEVRGAKASALDALESQLMVELPVVP